MDGDHAIIRPKWNTIGMMVVKRWLLMEEDQLAMTHDDDTQIAAARGITAAAYMVASESISVIGRSRISLMPESVCAID